MGLIKRDRRTLGRGDWRQEQVKRSQFKRGVKYKVGLPGALIIKARIVSKSNGRRIETLDYGTHSTNFSVTGEFKKLMEGAVMNAIGSHIQKGGKTGPKVRILDYRIRYIQIDRRVRREKGPKGKYRVVVRSKKSGKFITTKKWSESMSKDISKYNIQDDKDIRSDGL